MSRPVLVVHGVANRDEDAFRDQVAALGARIGLDRRWLPVYWGDLGAETIGIEATIPGVRQGHHVRGNDGVSITTDGPADASVALALLASTDDQVPDSAAETFTSDTPATRGPATGSVRSRADLAYDAARGMGDDVVGHGTRSTRGTHSDGDREVVARTLRDAWHETSSLKRIEDPALIAAIGAAIADGVLDEEPETAGAHLTRGPVSGLASGLRARTRSITAAIDRAVGSVLGSVGGRLNSFLRDTMVPKLGEFLGDVFVYQREWEAIRKRIFAVLDAEAPGWGTVERPVDVVAHSLGGLVCFDAALRGDPRLHINRFVTFGSQPAFFHVLDPRSDQVAPFFGNPVVLPATLRAWTNIVEPLDPLAFLAGNVFRLDPDAPTGAPDDHAIHHRASARLWTHSSYWTSDEAASRMRDALA